jgi:hypothetical protein
MSRLKSCIETMHWSFYHTFATTKITTMGFLKIKNKMKKLAFILTISLVTLFSCSRNIVNIEPKAGIIEIPAKGEFRIWKGIEHSSFSVKLTNNDPKQSVELYTVKSHDTEKWVSPSLLANSSLTITIPADGHLFIKNFNPNNFKISYNINE